MIQFELIKDNEYTVQGAIQFSEDGLIAIQHINANFRVTGNIYESLNYNRSVIPTPTFDTTLSIPEANIILKKAAQDWLTLNFPNIK